MQPSFLNVKTQRQRSAPSPTLAFCVYTCTPDGIGVPHCALVHSFGDFEHAAEEAMPPAALVLIYHELISTVSRLQD